MTGVKEGGGGSARARRRRSASSTASTAVATAVVSEAQARGSAGGRVRGPGRVRRLSTGRGDSTGGLGAGEARQWVSGSPVCSGGVKAAPSEWKRVSGEEAGNGWKQNLLAPERQAGPAASTSRGSRRPSWRCGHLARWGGADGRSTQEHKPPRFRLERGPQTRGDGRRPRGERPGWGSVRGGAGGGVTGPQWGSPGAPPGPSCVPARVHVWKL